MANEPAKSFRSFNLSVAVFKHQNEGKNGKFFSYSVIPQKSYKDDAGEYKNTSFLDQNDILSVCALLQQAWMWITSQRASDLEELKSQE